MVESTNPAHPTQSATDAELVRAARSYETHLRAAHLEDNCDECWDVKLANCLARLASRIEALSASRREYGEKCWKAGYQAYSDMIVQQSNGRKYSVMVAERMHADLDALEREEK